MGAVGTSGVYVLAQKILGNQGSSPTLLNSTSLNPGPATETVTVTTTVEAPSGGSSSAQGSATNVTATTSSGQSPPSGYILLAPLSAVTGKTYAYFTHPTGGSSILVNYSGTWKAFSAVCPHAGCTIDYTSSELYCPCHNAYFSTVNGGVLSGPPPTGLIEYGVQIINNNIYVSSSRVN
jgi:Rieske Fe-S protein